MEERADEAPHTNLPLEGITAHDEREPKARSEGSENKHHQMQEPDILSRENEHVRPNRRKPCEMKQESRDVGTEGEHHQKKETKSRE